MKLMKEPDANVAISNNHRATKVIQQSLMFCSKGIVDYNVPKEV